MTKPVIKAEPVNWEMAKLVSAAMRGKFPDTVAMLKRAIELAQIEKVATEFGDEMDWIGIPTNPDGWALYLTSRKMGQIVCVRWHGEVGTDDEHAEAIIQALEATVQAMAGQQEGEARH